MSGHDMIVIGASASGVEAKNPVLKQNAQDTEQSAALIRDLLLKRDDKSIAESDIIPDPESGNQNDN